MGETQLTIRCPRCQRVMFRTHPMTAATEVFRRKCRRCGQRWHLLVVPLLHREGVWAHKLEWQEDVR